MTKGMMVVFPRQLWFLNTELVCCGKDSRSHLIFAVEHGDSAGGEAASNRRRAVSLNGCRPEALGSF